ncbi:MAG: B12-binding domain-containing protein, partial [Deltaproteobacteria bacterium]|nr:B12-binding domain-containing protein [Deltaproteobacteria bacterium]
MTDVMPVSQSVEEECYQNYLEILLAGNRQQSAGIIQDLLTQGVQLKNVYLDLIQRAMYEIGTLWENNTVSIATEHLASATTELLLAQIYPQLFAQP